MNNISPFDHFSRKLPMKERSFKKLKGTELTLGDLYRSLGESLAYKRYGEYWDALPLAATLTDIETAMNVVEKSKQLASQGKTIQSFKFEVAGSVSTFKNWTIANIYAFSDCLRVLKRDLAEAQRINRMRNKGGDK